MSLRQVAQRGGRQLSLRSFATSRQKRALNEQQLGKAASSSSSNTPPPPAPPAKDGKATGGGSSILPIVGVLAVAGGAGAYYMDLIPDMPSSDSTPTLPVKNNAKPADEPKQEAPQKETPKVKKESKKEKKEEAAPAAPVKEEGPTGNRVLNITLPEGSSYSAAPAPITEHPAGGNRVKMEPAKEGNSPEANAAASVDNALKELQREISKDDTTRSLIEAHKDLAKLTSMDLSELDEMSMTQLKVRLVQMTKDMEERTKWEAVRLKEFLAMKEKEVEDKYALVLKKQRLEADSLLEQRMREQKDKLETQAKASLKEKEEALQAIVENSLKIQEQQYEDEKATFEKMADEKYNSKYEELFGTALRKAKEEFASRMEQKVQQIEALGKKLSDLEFALKSSKDYKSGSLQAHRMSAAALAFIDKMESSEPAGSSLEALKAVSDSNPVIQAVIGALPTSVASSGIPTLQELQTEFEEQVHAKCRQAAMVPKGQGGLEGQLLGMAFATLKFPPGPEDTAPESEKDDAEFVLARARRYVQLGELEQAVVQMEKLKGQPAFTAKDWTAQAKERLAVEKALKVIRTECALANEVLAKNED
eukprot:scaffold10507_cov128-Cylindrotheca_fusiformis.AAC.6